MDKMVFVDGLLIPFTEYTWEDRKLEFKTIKPTKQSVITVVGHDGTRFIVNEYGPKAASPVKKILAK